ncbi:MAG TPA: hypothetical protein VLB44_11015 [Kofleriaceae bacterium]|nr:hypothetical protein [Kofleriaceae bacterium]
MAGPIAIASALSRMTPIKCPWCGYRKLVTRHTETVAYRICSRCKRRFPDPLATKKKR